MAGKRKINRDGLVMVMTGDFVRGFFETPPKCLRDVEVIVVEEKKTTFFKAKDKFKDGTDVE